MPLAAWITTDRTAASKRPVKRSGPHHPRITPVSSLSTNPILNRKPTCACGGSCPKCQSELSIQPKLKIGAPNDKYEQEADRVADQVMRMPEPQVQRQSLEEEDEQIQAKSLGTPVTSLIQRQPEEEEEEEVIQTKSAHSQLPHPSTDIVSQIQDLKSSGQQPLEPSTRAFMEPRLGKDFSQVRIHTDTRAAETAKAINAKAFTLGRDIVFGSGQYQPNNVEGKRLLAHELTHVTQQTGGTHQRKLHSYQPGLQIASSAAPMTLQRACPKPPTGIASTISDADCEPRIGAESGDQLLFCQDSIDFINEQQQLHFDNLLPSAERATRIDIHGFASEEGSGDYNLKLACMRADAMAEKFRAAGVTAPIRLFTHGETTEYGERPRNRTAIVQLTLPPKKRVKERSEAEEITKEPVIIPLPASQPGGSVKLSCQECGEWTESGKIFVLSGKKLVERIPKEKERYIENRKSGMWVKLLEYRVMLRGDCYYNILRIKSLENTGDLPLFPFLKWEIANLRVDVRQIYNMRTDKLCYDGVVSIELAITDQIGPCKLKAAAVIGGKLKPVGKRNLRLSLFINGRLEGSCGHGPLSARIRLPVLDCPFANAEMTNSGISWEFTFEKCWKDIRIGVSELIQEVPDTIEKVPGLIEKLPSKIGFPEKSPFPGEF